MLNNRRLLHRSREISLKLMHTQGQEVKDFKIMMKVILLNKTKIIDKVHISKELIS